MTTGAEGGPEQILERLRVQSAQVEEALCAIVGRPPEDASDPDWVLLPLRLPTILAGLIGQLTLSSSHPDDPSGMYANVLVRGLWVMAEDEGLSNLARAAALLIWAHASEEVWQSWSARHPRAREYVAQHAKEPRDGC